jgi:hypothetical protein
MGIGVGVRFGIGVIPVIHRDRGIINYEIRENREKKGGDIFSQRTRSPK